MKLIAIDMDGTLLSDDGSVSPGNIRAIHEAQEAGHVVAIATGRSILDAEGILQRAGLECPIIGGNGGKIVHAGEVLQTWSFSDDTARDVIALIEEYGLYYEIYMDQGVRVKRALVDILDAELEIVAEFSDDITWAKQITGMQPKQYGMQYIQDFSGMNFNKDGLYKIFILSFRDQERVQVIERLSKCEDITVVTSGEQKVDISVCGASKGNALRFLSDYFGVELADTIAIGDNLNDVSMFELAGVGIAMENGEQELKDMSTFVTRTNNEDGVAYALREYVLK